MTDRVGDAMQARDGDTSVAHDDVAVEAASDRLSDTLVVQDGAHQSARRVRRTLGLFALAGLVVVAGIAIAVATRETEDVIAPGAGKHVAFVDVEGWYRRTPDEVAVLSPFDLALDALPDSLPNDIGRWRGADRAHDPAVDRWLRTPEVSIERTYTRDDGEVVWLSAFGSRGRRSFHLFEHTPDTCYPLGGWIIEQMSLEQLPRGPFPLTVNRGIASSEAGRMVFVYFYVWDTPARDSDRGVLSMRLSAPVSSDDETTLAMLTDDFLSNIFPATLDWVRF